MSSVDLEVAFEEAGCPICRLALQQERQWLWMLLWENINDPGIRESIVAAWGFCHRHAWGLARVEHSHWSQHFGTAIIYEHLTRWLVEYCDGGTGARNRRAILSSDRLARLDRVVPGHGCPACTARDRMERIYISWLARYCGEEWFARVYRDSDGLCLKHLNAALRSSLPPVRIFLLEVQLDNLRRARGESHWGLGSSESHPPVCNSPIDARPSLWLLAGADPYLNANGRSARFADVGSRSPRSILSTECVACTTELIVQQQRLTGLLARSDSARSSHPTFCAEHVWHLHALAIETRALETFGTWCSSALDLAREELDALLLAEQAAARRGSLLFRWLDRRRPPHFGADPPCAICAEMERFGRDRAATSAREAVQDAFDMGGESSLCLCHLRPAMSTVAAEKTAVLRARQLGRFRGLSWELREYVRKHDWQYRDEPKGQEQTSLRRAVALFVGDEKLPWSRAAMGPRGGK